MFRNLHLIKTKRDGGLLRVAQQFEASWRRLQQDHAATLKSPLPLTTGPLAAPVDSAGIDRANPTRRSSASLSSVFHDPQVVLILSLVGTYAFHLPMEVPGQCLRVRPLGVRDRFAEDMVTVSIPVDAETTSMLLEANPGKHVSVDDAGIAAVDVSITSETEADRSVVVPWLVHEDSLIDEIFDMNDDHLRRLEFDGTTCAFIVEMLNGFDTGSQEAEWCFQLGLWNRDLENPGTVWSSSVRSKVDFGGPVLDQRCGRVHWLNASRLPELWDLYDDAGGPAVVEFVPDFIGELRSSPGDSASKLRRKCTNWIKAGVRAVWLVDPVDEIVEVYRNSTTADVEVYEKPATLTEEDVLPGFVMDFRLIWDPPSRRPRN